MTGKIELRNKKWEKDNESHLYAYLSNGQLLLRAQDFTETAEKMFGDEKYEYGYTFDVANTNLIINSLNCKDLLKELKERFNWEDDETEFLHFLEINGIKFDYFK